MGVLLTAVPVLYTPLLSCSKLKMFQLSAMCALGFKFVRGSDSGGGGLCNCHSLPFEYDYGHVILELGVLC